MTVNDAIDRAAHVHSTEEEKARMLVWLNELEARIANELFGVESAAIGISDGGRVLLAPDAYAEVYPLYLAMQRELLSGDGNGYSLYSDRFTKAYKGLCNFVRRGLPLPKATYIRTV